MAYILAVNPDVLSAFKSGATGGDWTAVFLATAIAAGVMTIAMGLFVNFPVALAPGMGLNAYFATIILSSQGKFTFQMGLTAVFISGIIFLILTVTRIRQLLLVAIPDSLKHAITVGIGLFIAIIGFKNSGILFGILATTVVGYFMGMVDLGSLSSEGTTWVPDLGQLAFANRHYDDRHRFGDCDVYVCRAV